MKVSDRRDKILSILKKSDKAISGNKLAEELKVTRQIIVSDIAILKAAGEDIISTARGYIINNKDDEYILKTIACKHDNDEMEDELNIIVDEGATVVNVVVEHKIYGQITGDLYISSRRDVKDFMDKIKIEKSNPLSELTDGIHLHTIKCKNEDVFNELIKSLNNKGYLL